ncbi:tRNA/rRNA methyltransferase [Klebsiella variicola subsp. variicola]|nr:tRNA/rRNA methyltransferase [Klebsiella variicola subsp. variicola]
MLDGVTTYPTPCCGAARRSILHGRHHRPQSRARFPHYYATPQQLLPPLEEKAQWMTHAALVFGREDSGLSNEELALADVLTGVPMVADYPSLNLGQSVMVYCYQLASLMQQTAPAAAAADHHQLQALRIRTEALLSRLGVEEDAKLADWLAQRMGLLQQRDTAMLHRLLHDIEKTCQNKALSYFLFIVICAVFVG